VGSASFEQIGQSAVKRLWRQKSGTRVRARLAPAVANIRPVTTAIVSDFHLATRSRADVARRPEVRERLAVALAEANHVIFLGDTIELRELPVESVLRVAREVIGDLSGPLAGKRVTVVPGNHDHRLAEAALDRVRVEGGELTPEWQGAPETSPLAAELARALPESEVMLAYPGLRVRPDVYATHGHYLDLHLTMPRLEAVLGRASARRTLGPGFRLGSVAEYERVLGPLYSLSYNLAQGKEEGGKAASRSSNVSRAVWAAAHSDGRLGAFLVSRVAIPAGVAALNAAGIGPFSSELSGEALRLAGLRGAAKVVESLGVEAEHVIFGHTHRQGPLPGEEDEPGWRTPGGIRLWNTGSWFMESVLAGEQRRASPYWPGGVTYVRDSGPPEPVNVLRDLEL
jgi:UDP-2,3-diacylglucosamine pyrophosphatase LpxH